MYSWTRVSPRIINYPFFTSLSSFLLLISYSFWHLSVVLLFLIRDSQPSPSSFRVCLFIFHLFRGHFACHDWPILYSQSSWIDCFMSFVHHSVRNELYRNSGPASLATESRPCVKDPQTLTSFLLWMEPRTFHLTIHHSWKFCYI